MEVPMEPFPEKSEIELAAKEKEFWRQIPNTNYQKKMGDVA